LNAFGRVLALSPAVCERVHRLVRAATPASVRDIIYVFATKGGAPTNPDWYRNLTAAGDGTVERGTETYEVTVRELAGAERDRIYAEQALRYPGFAEYERQAQGVVSRAHAPVCGVRGRANIVARCYELG
jgi:deazaflavin-dependent oxidoreductase (nitroreductase family)